MKFEDQSSHIIELCKELLDDIELGRIDTEKVLFKAIRLARLTGANEIQKWLKYEISGYTKDNLELNFNFNYFTVFSRISRFISSEHLAELIGITSCVEIYKCAENIYAVCDPLPSLAVKTGLLEMQMADPKTVDILYRQRLNLSISKLNLIQTCVKNSIHDFVCEIYYEKLFSGLSESLFQIYKESIDNRLADKCGDVLEKIPAIFERLSNGDTEAISHALLTCRRIIDSFADSIYPPQDEEIEIDGNQISLKADKYKNRINAYIRDRVESKDRRDKLRQTLSNLYSRVSSGVHSDVSINEAKALFLEVYLFLGEVVSL